MSALAANGRWNGAVTSRPLPDARDELAELAPALREHLARIWLSQAATEARVAGSFTIVHRALLDLGADRGIVATAQRAIDDEHRHTGLCRDVAARYFGAPVIAPPVLELVPPRHELAPSVEARQALWVVGQCAFNETFASAYLSLCHERAETKLARAALRELLSDEIDHARIGWAYLDSMPSHLAAVVQDWLVPLAESNLREWRKVRLVEDESLAKHGIPPAPAVEEALLSAVTDLIVPGMAHVGLDPTALARWSRMQH